MSNISGNASASGSWDNQAPNAWQQQQKNKQIISGTGKIQFSILLNFLSIQ